MMQPTQQEIVPDVSAKAPIVDFAYVKWAPLYGYFFILGVDMIVSCSLILNYGFGWWKYIVLGLVLGLQAATAYTVYAKRGLTLPGIYNGIRHLFWVLAVMITAYLSVYCYAYHTSMCGAASITGLSVLPMALWFLITAPVSQLCLYYLNNHVDPVALQAYKQNIRIAATIALVYDPVAIFLFTQLTHPYAIPWRLLPTLTLVIALALSYALVIGGLYNDKLFNFTKIYYHFRLVTIPILLFMGVYLTFLYHDLSMLALCFKQAFWCIVSSSILNFAMEAVEPIQRTEFRPLEQVV